MPTISVLMAVYHSEFLDESIRSILCQTFRDFEFIIVNDGSPSVTKILERFRDRRIHVINNDRNVGLTRSLNYALDIAHGQIIARHDADDVSLPERFEKQLPLLSNNVGLVSCWADAINQEGRQIFDYWLDTITRSDKNTLLDYLEKQTNPFVAPGAMFTRDVVKKIGYFDPIIKYAQDFNYWLRLLKYFDFEIVPEVLILKRKHKNCIWEKHNPVEYIVVASERAASHPRIPPITL